ncbi:hypothetical protein JGU71_20520 [Antrihabitans sp. YC3-6]|uniref:Uncharacterized protein n=1 Tax=Antrihabitans stalagmiti TaxID=2799499 RepID=A0A934NU07_9NOCA|nr:hypothetical protein [Antrihabitans stalagmiti]MBJ8341273.1 hypothetical protein [Antrihabitans stalagmiti]
MSQISVNWSSLAWAAALSMAIGLTLITVFTVGVLGYDRGTDPHSTPGQRTGGRVLAGTALAICAAAVLLGVYLLIPRLH